MHVADGDTYSLLIKGKVIETRLTNVDAPEKMQDYGSVVKDQLSKLLNKKILMFDSVGTDKYKRVLVRIWISGQKLDSLLVRNGLAWVYTEYCKDASLANLQSLAISEHKGLWRCGVGKVCPPWMYRHFTYKNKLRYCSGCKM